MHAALDRGINFFDTAEGYGGGRSEEVLGDSLAGRRSSAVIATKIVDQSLDQNRVAAACEESLRRLKTDYIDLYYIHWPNPAYPLAGTLEAMARLKEQGKVRSIGICNFGMHYLGMMDMPTFEGSDANQVNYLQVGGCYGVNADSAYPEKAAELVAEMATPEMASLWMSEIMGQTGIKGGSAPAESEYLQKMNEVIDSLTLVTGPLATGMAPEYINEYESVTTLQLLGEITVDEMIDRLEAARTAYAQ